jgi:ferritin
MFSVVRCSADPTPPRDIIKRIRREHESKRIKQIKSIQELLKKTADEEVAFIKMFFPEKKKETVKVEILEEDEDDF